MMIPVRDLSDYPMKLPIHKFVSKVLKATIKAGKDEVDPYLFYQRYKASPRQVLTAYQFLNKRQLVIMRQNDTNYKMYYIGK